MQFKVETYDCHVKVKNLTINTYNNSEYTYITETGNNASDLWESGYFYFLDEQSGDEVVDLFYASNYYTSLDENGLDLSIFSGELDLLEVSYQPMILLDNSDIKISNSNLDNPAIISFSSNVDISNTEIYDSESTFLLAAGDSSSLEINNCNLNNIKDIISDSEIYPVTIDSSNIHGFGQILLLKTNSPIEINNSVLSEINNISTLSDSSSVSILNSTLSNFGDIETYGVFSKVNLANSNMNYCDSTVSTYNHNSPISMNDCNIIYVSDISTLEENSPISIHRSDLDMCSVESQGGNSSIDLLHARITNAPMNAVATNFESDITANYSIISHANGIGLSSDRYSFLNHVTIFSNLSYGVYTGNSGLSYLKNSIVALNNNSYSNQISGELETTYSITSADPNFSNDEGHLEEYSPGVDGAEPWETDTNMPMGLGTFRADMGAYGGPENDYWGGTPVPQGNATILSVEDKPQDQGGNVGVLFEASVWDDSELENNVTSYAVWRHFDPAGGLIDSIADGNWELVAQMPAQSFESYAITSESM